MFVAQKSWRTAVRRAILVIVGVSGYVAIELLPSWLPAWQESNARWLRRGAAIAFLDAMAIVYTPVFVAAIVIATVLAYGRLRGPLSPSRARVLLLSTSVVFSLLALEAGAAVWQAWLHRSPKLMSARPTESTLAADADRSRDLTTGSAPDLTSRLSSAKSGITAGAAPLRILVIGESSAAVSPIIPGYRSGKLLPGGWKMSSPDDRYASISGRKAVRPSRRCTKSWPISRIARTQSSFTLVIMKFRPVIRGCARSIITSTRTCHGMCS